jgi:signal transduction histidine kinase
MRLGLSTRLSLAFAALLCGFGALVAAVGARALDDQQQETLQLLSRGLARHIVEHWPGLAAGGGVDRRSLDRVLDMLMVVNPAIEVYLLEPDGRVAAYLGDPAAVRQPRVALGPVRAFLSGATLPLRCTDPRASSGPGRIFSAAPLPAGGFLYVVLEGEAAARIAGHVGRDRLWRGAAWMLAAALLATLALGALTFTQLTRPLRRLAQRMHAYRDAGEAPPPPASDEVAAMATAFERLGARIESQIDEQARAQAAHREVIANVAHDLRTPLTALHGHLEALQRELSGQADAATADSGRRLRIALDQSDKVRRLSQQLFELASLQASEQVAHVERFRLDELVSDAVQKFAFAPVALAGPPPEPLVLEGDLQLVERALTNLIDNALRHAPGRVQVRLQRDAAKARIVVEDRGPGLPAELRRRLNAGESLRQPPMRRPGGGFGGLGLAIAQRIAQLHGGSLSTQPAPHGGTVLCLALPLAA